MRSADDPREVLLSKGYDPEKVERKWYDRWQEKGYFHADEKKPGTAYSIVIPPPNITGSLHMGHAFNNTIQDILVRWKRMEGAVALWMPGTDHAGIGTQNVVERRLAEEGTDRDALGREEFIRRVWRWKEEHGGNIIHQLMRLGASCDWERERFTMDEGLSAAVREVFVRLYREGLIYRGDYIVNWCPRCQTALSDLEVEHQEIRGNLYYVRYPAADSGGGVVVATTRPETILGDTAVAVNPDDPRHSHLRGKRVKLPIIGRIVPVIGDEYVDTGFGTGALKITPAHDFNDFEVGNRHNLERINILTERGIINENGGAYAGLDRFKCREVFTRDLKEAGHLVKVEGYTHSVGHCYRCKTIVEPYISKQWFVRIWPLAEPAIRAVQEGRVRIVPPMWEKTYFDWMNNIKDWCISRQIWWGHRIPAWYCGSCGGTTVDSADPAACSHCGSADLHQDMDVLDTWFSSALWPFSTLGWPERTEALERFYPTSCLVTGFDILFFWVARMMMMGLKFMGDVPFRDVYIHALVRDAEGQKMSKSKGNVIDPLVMMDKYGTDAFRFTLAAFAAQGRDVKLSEERIEGYRHFANKIWNAARFVLSNLDDEAHRITPREIKPELAERWILSRLAEVTGSVRKSLEEYRFNDAANAIYHFFWHEYCDWYVEISKPKLRAGEAERRTAQCVLVHVLDVSMRLLHPIMPFITEEVWQLLPRGDGESIVIAPYPEAEEDRADPEAEKEMGYIMGILNNVRIIRSENNIPSSRRINVVLKTSKDREPLLKRHDEYFRTLANIENLKITSRPERPEFSATAVVDETEIFVPLTDLVDFREEEKRIGKELSRAVSEVEAAKRKLENENFLSRAPEEVISREKEKLERLIAKEGKLREGWEKIKRFASEEERRKG